MLKITPIPAFSDNYIWIIANTDNSEAFLVDPGDGKVALNALDAANLTIAGVLVTHHHPDHVGGLDLILSRSSKIPIYGPNNPTIKQITHCLSHADTVSVFGFEFTVMEIPGHTLDHIAYYCGDYSEEPL